MVDGFQRGRRESVEGPVESVVLGDKVAVKLRKSAQRVAIVDALAQFAIVPVLDAHESQRSSDSLAAISAEVMPRFINRSTRSLRRATIRGGAGKQLFALGRLDVPCVPQLRAVL